MHQLKQVVSAEFRGSNYSKTLLKNNTFSK